MALVGLGMLKNGTQELLGAVAPSLTPHHMVSDDLFFVIRDSIQRTGVQAIGAIRLRNINLGQMFLNNTALGTAGKINVLIFLLGDGGSPNINAQPALFLQEVQEDNLTQQLLSKLLGSKAAALGLLNKVLIAVQVFLQLIELLTVKLEEFLGNLFDAECLFQLIERGIGVPVENELPETVNSSVRGFVLTNQERITLSGGKILRSLELALLNLHFVIQADEGQTPLRLTFCIECNDSCIAVAALNQLFGIATLGASGTFDIAFLFQLHREDSNLLALGGCVVAYMSLACNMGREVRKLLPEVIGRNEFHRVKDFLHQLDEIRSGVFRCQDLLDFIYDSIHALPPRR